MNKLSVDITQLITGLTFSAIGIWLIFGNVKYGWLSFAFGCVILLHVASSIKPQLKRRTPRKNQEVYDEAYIEEIAATNKVPESDIEVWTLLLENTQTNGVVFENGTLVICENKSQLTQTAIAIIDEFVETIPGTYLGDFTVRLYPNTGIWLVSYPSDNVFNYVAVADCKKEACAGLMAREIRQADARQKNIVYTYKYN